jgi:hypothetical protein
MYASFFAFTRRLPLHDSLVNAAIPARGDYRENRKIGGK